MPSTHSELLMPTASTSPPGIAHLMPTTLARSISSGLKPCFIAARICAYTSLMAITPSTWDFSCPTGDFTAVIFAAQGVMKNTPTSALSTPCFCAYSSLAIFAAASMGETKSITLSSSAGKLT